MARSRTRKNSSSPSGTSRLHTVTRLELLEIIRAALDCPTHFHKPTIIENDPDFHLGDNPLVICSQCVKRMRDALGLKDGEQAPTSYRMLEMMSETGTETTT